MSRFTGLCAAALLSCSVPVLADSNSHAADAERFLQLAHADKLVVPVYAQVQQMFAQRFAESHAPKNKQALLESYQAKANIALDNAVGWDKIKPDMVKLYTSNFSEAELKELIAFYESPLGQKVLLKVPALTAQSARLTQSKLEQAVPEVNKLLADMSADLGDKQAE
nr:DUF2059 domain-containing protein [uncultured Pseudomonas sp.]